MSRMMPSGGRRRVHPVDPGAGQIGSAARLASVASHSVSNRPIWLVEAASRSSPSRPTMARMAGIAREPLGVVDVLVAGEAAVDRLSQQAEQPVADVLPTPALGESRHGHRGQAEGVVQLAVGEQAAIPRLWPPLPSERHQPMT